MLYFFFLKCILIVSVVMIITDSYKAYTYAKKGKCGSPELPKCNPDPILYFTIANYGSELNRVNRLIWAGFSLLVMALNFWMIRKAKRIDKRVDILEDSPADYTLMVIEPKFQFF